MINGTNGYVMLCWEKQEMLLWWEFKVPSSLHNRKSNNAAISWPQCIILQQSKSLQPGVACAAEAGKSRSPSGSRCYPCWASVPVHYRGHPAGSGQNFPEGMEVLQHITNHINHCSSVLKASWVSHKSPNVQTFGSWSSLSAHSLNAVEAEGFDGAQLQHLCVIKDAADLIPDPVQGHNFPLGEPESDSILLIFRAWDTSPTHNWSL